MDRKRGHQQHSMYIGRFQPFHHGHLNNIKHILERGERPLIVLGSAQHHRKDRHPLNVAERTAIIVDTLTAEGISPKEYHITCLEDINNDDIWPSYLVDSLPTFDKVYTGSEKVRGPLEKDGRFPVIQVPLTENISATKIREMIRNDETGWEDLVHPVVASHLKDQELIDYIKHYGL